MITDLHIRASARRMVAVHGPGAWPRAVAETEARAAAGDWGQVAVWRRIGGAIRALEHEEATARHLTGPIALQSLAALWSGRPAAPRG